MASLALSLLCEKRKNSTQLVLLLNDQEMSKAIYLFVSKLSTFPSMIQANYNVNLSCYQDQTMKGYVRVDAHALPCTRYKPATQTEDYQGRNKSLQVLVIKRELIGRTSSYVLPFSRPHLVTAKE